MDLSAIPIVDQHAHNLLRPESAKDFAYPSAFTEGYAAEVVTRHAQETIFFRRSMREIAELLGCEPRLEAILEARGRLGFEEVARRCFAAAGFETILLDDGFMPDRVMPTRWHSRFAQVRRLLRVEFLAEQLMGALSSWEAFEEAFRAALHAPDPEVVGFKTIVAYRTGLAIEPPDPEAARAAFQALRRQAERGERLRLAHKPLNDWVVWRTLEAAAHLRLPVQFHTGFGDPDLDLRWANPLHLRPLLEHPGFQRVPFVLLHASYPYTREAGYLAAVYPHVYVDLGLAIPFLSRSGMAFAVRAFLEFTPLSKIMFSTDAHLIPELFYLGARWGRRILGEVLEETIRAGDLTATEAEEAAEAILRRNARTLYGL
ncbi:amidohydrolase family protein [Thermoflexus sp.]|uniref:amidohydrolase family protein n=1 Tax=Thermoflexus sp. TaxID=1969742 RepID=UPI00176C5174|nr:amidohydrolase family protein [Thermoflexus sp.]